MRAIGITFAVLIISAQAHASNGWDKTKANLD
jgi:hypothetical protein